MNRKDDGSVVLTEEEATVIEEILYQWNDHQSGASDYIDLMDEAVSFWVFND